MRLARDEGRVLLTEDNFGWYVYVTGERGVGVVPVRFPSGSRRVLGSAVLETVRSAGGRLLRSFTRDRARPRAGECDADAGNGSSLGVDFILRRGKDLIALEVRSGRKVFDADLRGLRAIADVPQVVRRIVVCRGDRRQKTADGIDILPVAAFLAQLEGQSLFP